MPDKVCSLDDAVAHVRAGDAVHVVTNHTRWTAGARHLVRRLVGQGPRIHPGHAQPVEPRRPVLPRGPGLEGRHRLLGRRLPQLLPEPLVRLGLPRRRGRGRALVVPHLPPAARGGGPRPACRHHRVAGRLVDGRQPGLRPGGDALRRGRAARGLCARCHPAPRSDRSTARATSPSTPPAWRGSGERSPPAAASSPPSTGWSTTSDRGPTSSRVPGHRVLAVAETPMGAHPGGLFARDTPVDPYGEDLEFWAEARTASHGDDFDEWIEHWVLGPSDQDQYLDRLGTERIARLRRRAEPDSWRDDEAAHPPTSTLRWWPGRPPPSTGPATWPDGSPTSAPTPCWPGPGWPTWPPGWRSSSPGAGLRRRADRRARSVGLRADTRRPVRLQPPELPDGHHAGRRRPGARHAGRADRAPPCSAAWAPPRSTDTATSTRRSSPARSSWSGREGGTTWRRAPTRSW